MGRSCLLAGSHCPFRLPSQGVSQLALPVSLTRGSLKAFAWISGFPRLCMEQWPGLGKDTVILPRPKGQVPS